MTERSVAQSSCSRPISARRSRMDGRSLPQVRSHLQSRKGGRGVPRLLAAAHQRLLRRFDAQTKLHFRMLWSRRPRLCYPLLWLSPVLPCPRFSACGTRLGTVFTFGALSESRFVECAGLGPGSHCPGGHRRARRGRMSTRLCTGSLSSKSQLRAMVPMSIAEGQLSHHRDGATADPLRDLTSSATAYFSK